MRLAGVNVSGGDQPPNVSFLKVPSPLAMSAADTLAPAATPDAFTTWPIAKPAVQLCTATTL